jgi:diguanylate cyclase (GGDEF)-like protein
MEKPHNLENADKLFRHLSIGNSGEERLLVARALISAKERKIKNLEHDAHHDPLTGVLNRRGLDNQLEIMTRENHSPEALLYIDLTNFKAVNDNFGYEEGDKALISMTELLKSTIRKKDKLARIGGDEFIVILGDETKDLEENTDIGHRDIDGAESDTKIIYAKARIGNEMKDFLDENDHLKKVGFDLAVGGVVWKPGSVYEELRPIAERFSKEAKAVQHKANGSYR